MTFPNSRTKLIISINDSDILVRINLYTQDISDVKINAFLRSK